MTISSLDNRRGLGSPWIRPLHAIIAATLAHYAFGHHLKTLVEYQKRLELHGASMANDAVIAGVQLAF